MLAGLLPAGVRKALQGRMALCPEFQGVAPLFPRTLPFPPLPLASLLELIIPTLCKCHFILSNVFSSLLVSINLQNHH